MATGKIFPSAETPLPEMFSRREREIMDALYAAVEADVEQIRARLKDPPGYDSVRTILRILESKGHVRRSREGRRHIYRPVQDRATAIRKAWRNLVNTFFEGSQERAAATLMRPSEVDHLDDQKMADLVLEARRTRQRRKAPKR
jgi:BlaI family penicillinase repressor